MANNWQSVDANFPTFDESESPYDQIKKLVDYMRQLTDMLRFSLNNLGTDNWNSSHLREFSAELTGDIEKDLQTCLAAVQALQNTVRGLSATVTTQTAQIKKIAELEETVKKLSETAQSSAENIKKQEETIKKISERQTSNNEKIETIQSFVSPLCEHMRTEPDMLTIGYDGSTLKLQGDVYINDILQEG